MTSSYREIVRKLQSRAAGERDVADAALDHEAAMVIKDLLELIETYGDMPFPCHDHMTKDQWTAICGIVAARHTDKDATS